ncbi:lipopolysaccharide biosynthesis protein [Chitinophagaceae bacterium MMS25-I14]
MQPEKTRSFLSDSLYLFLYRFFPTLASFLVVVYYSRQLPEPVYGAYQKFWVNYYVFGAIACTGLHVLILTYTPAYLRQLFAVLKRKLLLPALWILCTGIVYGLYEMHSFSGIILPAVFLCVLSFTAIAESALSVFRKFGVLLLLNILYAAIFLWLHWRAAHSPVQDLKYLLWLVTCIALVRLLIYCFVLAGALRKQPVPVEEHLSFKAVQVLWMHMGIYDIIQVLFRWVDKFIMGLFLGPALYAIYFNGSVDIPFLPVVLGAVGSAGLMRMAAVNESGTKKNQLVQLMHASSRVLACVALPLFFFLFFFRRELFSVVFTHRYEMSIPIFLCSIITIPVRAYNFTSVLQHYHKGRIINAGALLDIILACVLMYPMYRLMGLPGVALAFSVTTFIQAAFYLYHSARILEVSMFRLLPVGNLLIKGIVFFVFFITLYNISSAFLTPQIALFLGCAGFIVVSLAALLTELKQDKRNNGKSFTKA